MAPNDPSASTAQPPNSNDRSSEPVNLDLWKYFEDQASKLKDAMFTLVTWMIGLASALLGFIVNEGLSSNSSKVMVVHPLLVLCLSIAGLLIVRYAFIAVREHGRHMERNFKRAEAARGGESSLPEIWEAGEKGLKGALPGVCRHLHNILWLFAVGFGLLFLAALLAVK